MYWNSSGAEKGGDGKHDASQSFASRRAEEGRDQQHAASLVDTWYFDAHMHLARIGSVDVFGMCRIRTAICVSEHEKDLKKVLSMAEAHRGIVPFAGTHPRVLDMSDIERQASHIKSVAGIGEVGLDFTVARSPELRAVQMAIFRAWLQIGEAYGKPVVVHSRHAEKAVLATLREYRVVAAIHAYSGPLDVARELIKMGHYFSFPPVSSPIRAKLMRLAPLERVLVESDAPYIASPCRIRRAISAISRERGIPEDRVVDALWTNLAAFLGRAP